jgi:purine-cytosine permease-like protein
VYQLLVFTFSYSKISTSQVSLQCFGAAAAIAASSVPVWEQGYTSGSVGGLLEAILRPLGNFGKFLMVLLSLSVAGNNVVTFYSISLSLQAFIPMLVVVPRYMFSVVATAV